MKFLNLLIILCFSSLCFSQQQQTQVCIVDANNDSSTIDPSINIKYLVTTTDQQTVELNAIRSGDCFTLDYGNVNFDDITFIKLIPDADLNPLNGVSTYDLVLMVRHILGLSNLECTPIQEYAFTLAGDVNNNGFISTMDALQLRQLILGLISELQSNNSWRFVDYNLLNEVLADPNVNVNLGELIYFKQQLQGELKLLGVKVGNLNGICE